MSDFDQQIQQDRRKNRLRYSMVGSVIILCLCLYGLWLFLVKDYGFIVSPQEVQENYSISLNTGTGFFIKKTLYLFSNHASVAVASPGFVTETVAITPETASRIAVTLKPKPATLIGNTKPSQADTVWLINNDVVHTGAQLQHTLPPGEYTIAIKHKKYKTVEEKITLERDTTVNKTWELQAVKVKPVVKPVPKKTPPREEQKLPAPEKTPPPKQQKTVSHRDLGITMLRFKPQRFIMGSPPNEKGRLRNEFQLEVDFTRAIYVSRHEITQAQYAAFKPGIAPNKLPVSNVSWLDAVRFCNWLSEQEKRPVFYRISNGRVVGVNPQANGYRLLTEAEWEWLAKKARRAAATVYVWGNEERIPAKSVNIADQSVANSRVFSFKNYNDGFQGKAPVGSFKPDRIGLYDLAGNVSEWVHDLYTNMPPDLNRVAVDYLGANRGVGHIVKGGNYQTGRFAELRSAYRHIGQQSSPAIGFRIARYQ